MPALGTRPRRAVGLRLESECVPSWPRLAWLARLVPGRDSIEVRHGAGVEVEDGWICEAAWAGAYEEGGFDRTDIVAGTGVRIRESRALFVSSGSTEDRLQSLDLGGERLISNSLPCLLASAGARFDPTHPHYDRDLNGRDLGPIGPGLLGFQGRVPTTLGARAQLTYFDNLGWDGDRLRAVAKPDSDAALPDFGAYRSLLADSLRALIANARDTRRRRPLEVLTTVSGGYDSPAVSALAAEAGCERALCFTIDRDGVAEGGATTSRRLGLVPIEVLDRPWEPEPLAEVTAVAVAASPGLATRFRAAAEHLEGTLLLTGYYGDTIWKRRRSTASDGSIATGSGELALTEYRLDAGFLHCPVPFWGFRRAAEIGAISRSEEMRPWDIGGGYSRPIARRICEEAGVPREAFGQRKLAPAVMFWYDRRFLSPGSVHDYQRWLRARRPEFVRRGRIPPPTSELADRIVHGSRLALRRRLKRLEERIGPQQEGRALRVRAAARSAIRSIVFGRGVFGRGPKLARRYAPQWAMEHAVRRYER